MTFEQTCSVHAIKNEKACLQTALKSNISNNKDFIKIPNIISVDFNVIFSLYLIVSFNCHPCVLILINKRKCILPVRKNGRDFLRGENPQNPKTGFIWSNISKVIDVVSIKYVNDLRINYVDVQIMNYLMS